MGVILRTRKRKDGTKTLWLDIYLPRGRAGEPGGRGRRWAEFLDLRLTGHRNADQETLTAAEMIRARRQIELALNSHSLTAAHKQRADFFSFANKIAFEDKRIAKIWRPFIAALKDFTKGQAVPFASIDSSFVRRFQSFMLKRWGPNTAQNREKSCFRVILNRACASGFMPVNPYRAKTVSPLPLYKPQRTYLLESEIQALADASCLSETTKAGFLFACSTGLRISDIRSLKWESIDRRAGILTVRQGKTKTMVSIPLSETAKEILNRLLPMGILPGPGAKVFNLPTSTTVDFQLKRWACSAGIQKNLHFHISRHSFALNALVNGIDLFTVSRLLGHSTVRETQTYLHLAEPLMNQAAEKGLAIRLK